MALILRTPLFSDIKRQLPKRGLAEPAIDVLQPPVAEPDSGHEEIELRLAGIRAEAATIGYQDGFAQGERDAARGSDERLANLDKLAASMRAQLSKGLAEIEDTAVAIAFEACCKLLGDSLTNRAAIAERVALLLGQVRNSANLVVRVNPEDLLELGPLASFGADQVADLKWLADSGVARGDCVVETDAGSLEARLDAQLLELKQVLLAARGAAPRQEADA
jgi:flagellar biosynthesis/type III secretory pathway protein FliH